jgi:glycosyltransferase involved in cell wall biosynthesis
MRVLQINKFFFEKGGSERYLFSVSRALEEKGHEVLHFSMQHPRNEPSPYADYFVAERDYHEAASLPKQLSTASSMIRSREVREQVSKLIRDKRPDVAHLHNIYHQLTPSVIEALDRAGIPMVLTLHDYKLVCPKYSLFDGRRYCYRCRGGHFFRAPFARCVDNSFIKSAILAFEGYWQRATHAYDAVRFLLAPSEYMRDLIVDGDYGAERVLYLRSFVTPEEVAADAGFASTELARSLPDKYVLYFGRLSEEKGLLTLLDAISQVDDMHLVLCGDGPLRTALETRVHEQGTGHRVLFAGFVGKPDLNSIVGGARCVVMPSEWPENAPFTVIEAMAMGVPVVVSTMGGLPELAERAGGKQFEAGDASALADCIGELWRNDGLVDTIATRSREAVRTDFNRDVHLEALIGIYQRAIDAKGSRS